ncbi:MAG TPA: M56 family metallopeptidase [Candidatus Krumholzibacteria bacterium]|nr:M56 family metallopeptidase [Candidatus Krumholzibacteria bacterium]
MGAIHSLMAWPDAFASIAVLTWLVRITVIAACACGFLALARRMPPTMRHAVAVGSLLLVVLLPAASKLLPAVSIPILKSPVTVTTAKLIGDEAVYRIDDMKPAIVNADRTPVVVGAIDAAPAQLVPAEKASIVSRVVARVKSAYTSGTNWIRLGFVLWVMVGTGLLVRLAVSFAKARRLAGRAMLVDDEALREEVERACRLLGVTRHIDVAVSDEVDIPMVAGVIRPRVILPAAAAEWSRERLAVVLLHEIAHIRRSDCVSMLFARVVGASLWFHPLVVMLSRHVRRESERACDERVLSTGVLGSDYAAHLVSIARLTARRDLLGHATLAFAARSTLEERVASILSGRPRPVRARITGLVMAAALAVFAFTAAVRPTASSCAVVPYHGYSYEFSQQQQQKLQEQVQNSIQTQFRYSVAGNHHYNSEGSDGAEWYNRASDYYHREQFGKAARAYMNAARFEFQTATAYYNAGCSYALDDQSTEAIDALQKAFDEGFDDLGKYASDDDLNSLRQDPRFKKLMDTVMKSDEGQQQRRAALRDYDRLAGRTDVDDGDWNSVGVDLMRVGEYDKAATAFDNEFKRSRNEDEDAIYNKACARALQGKSDEALKLLEQAIATGSVDPEHMRKDSDLVSLHKNKRFDELVDLAEDLELNYSNSWGDNGWVFKNGKVRHESDDKYWKKSLAHFEEMTRDHPKLGRAWFNLGYAQLESGDAKAGTASFQKALDLGFKPSVMMYNLACSTAQEGNVDAAFSWLEKSENAGFRMWQHARWDDDLDPLRADPRWKEMKAHWKDEERKQASSPDIHINFD